MNQKTRRVSCDMNELMAFVLCAALVLFIFKNGAKKFSSLVICGVAILVFVFYIIPMLRG